MATFNMLKFTKVSLYEYTPYQKTQIWLFTDKWKVFCKVTSQASGRKYSLLWIKRFSENKQLKFSREEKSNSYDLETDRLGLIVGAVELDHLGLKPTSTQVQHFAFWQVTEFLHVFIYKTKQLPLQIFED